MVSASLAGLLCLCALLILPVSHALMLYACLLPGESIKRASFQVHEVFFPICFLFLGVSFNLTADSPCDFLARCAVLDVCRSAENVWLLQFPLL